MMNVTLLIKSLNSGKVEASVLELPAYRVEAATKEEAIAHLQTTLLEKVQDAAVISLHLPVEVTTHVEHPWKKLFGIFQDDPYFQEVMEIIQAERDALGDEEIDPAYYLSPES